MRALSRCEPRVTRIGDHRAVGGAKLQARVASVAWVERSATQGTFDSCSLSLNLTKQIRHGILRGLRGVEAEVQVGGAGGHAAARETEKGTQPFIITQKSLI